MIVGDNLSVENDGITTTNMTITSSLNGRAVSDILPTYKKYIALITQTSTNAPTVIELENTIGPIVWTRTAVGQYDGTLTGAFIANKTYLTISSTLGNYIISVYRNNNDTIRIESNLDAQLYNNTLEIRVYE